MKRFLLAALALLAITVASSCSREPSSTELSAQYDAGYKAGDDAGFKRGVEAGNEAGFQNGRVEGFNAVFPPGTPGYLPSGSIFGKIIAVAGAVMIVVEILSLLWFLMERSTSGEERAGKAVMLLIGSLTAYFVAPLSGFSRLLASLLLLPAPIWSWLVLLVAGAASFGAAKGIERLWPRIHGIYLEGWSMLFVAALLTALVQVILRIFIVTPSLENYLAPHVLIGFLMGGLLFWALKLFDWAIRRAHLRLPNTPVDRN